MRLCYIILGGTGDNAMQLLNKKYMNITVKYMYLTMQETEH